MCLFWQEIFKIIGEIKWTLSKLVRITVASEVRGIQLDCATLTVISNIALRIFAVNNFNFHFLDPRWLRFWRHQNGAWALSSPVRMPERGRESRLNFTCNKRVHIKKKCWLCPLCVRKVNGDVFVNEYYNISLSLFIRGQTNCTLTFFHLIWLWWLF